jgi:secernin
VLETAGRFSAVEEVRSGVRAISNGLTIPGFAEEHSDRFKSWVSQCRIRRGVSERVAGEGAGLKQMMRVLRDNGTGAGPAWSMLNGSMKGPNMHAGGLGTSSQTVSSWVSQLKGSEHQHWVTGTADAALSVFFPARFDEPQSFGQASNRFDQEHWWWQGELLHRLALHNWEAAERLIAESRDALQHSLLAEQASTETALASISAQREAWIELLRKANLAETRPWWVRRLWRGWNSAAGFPNSQQLQAKAGAS